jgi:N-acetylglucosaminyl-diphospho-decaprenol L-rhamnosyltransferase
MARIDLIVVCWNDRERIGAALDSVFALDEVRADPDLVNVVVVDNGSTDESPAFVRERYGTRVMLIENGSNLGFGAGVNRARAATSAEYVYLLNPDAEVRDRALAHALAFMERTPRCGIGGSRIYNPDGTIQPSLGEFDTWTGAFLRSSAWGELPPLRRFANGAGLRDFCYDRERRADLATGAAVMIRRKLVEDIGAFDEQFFLYHEEVDLAKRAADAGWETWFIPASEAVHLGMGSSGGRHRLVEVRKQRSRRAYWIKHHGRWWYRGLVAALIGRYALYAGAVIGALVLGQRALRR